MPSLTRDEAIARADLLSVTRMEVELDLDRGAATFGSVTRIHLTAAADGQTFVDVKPETLHHARLDGVELDVTSLREGRLPLAVTAGEHVLEVDATMAYSHDGEGLHRATDPADGEDYVFSHLFLDAAPAVLGAFGDRLGGKAKKDAAEGGKGGKRSKGLAERSDAEIRTCADAILSDLALIDLATRLEEDTAPPVGAAPGTAADAPASSATVAAPAAILRVVT